MDGAPTLFSDPTGEIAPLLAMGIGAAFGGGVELMVQLSRNGGRWDCVNWVDVGLVALSSVSVGGRLGYKATLQGLAPYARTLSKRGAYDLRGQIRRQYRLFGKVDDFLKKRDKTFDQVTDPHDSFGRSHPGWDVGLTAPGAIAAGGQIGLPTDLSDNCGCR